MVYFLSGAPTEGPQTLNKRLTALKPKDLEVEHFIKPKLRLELTPYAYHLSR